MGTGNGQDMQRAAVGERLADFLVHPQAASKEQRGGHRRIAGRKITVEQDLAFSTQTGRPPPKRRFVSLQKTPHGVRMVGRDQAGGFPAAAGVGRIEGTRIRARRAAGRSEPATRLPRPRPPLPHAGAALADAGGPPGPRPEQACCRKRDRDSAQRRGARLVMHPGGTRGFAGGRDDFRLVGERRPEFDQPRVLSGEERQIIREHATDQNKWCRAAPRQAIQTSSMASANRDGPQTRDANPQPAARMQPQRIHTQRAVAERAGLR